VIDPHVQLDHLKRAALAGSLEIPRFVLPASHQVGVGAVRLQYLEWRPTSGSTTLLFLHGAALTAHTWDLVCLQLRESFRCLAVDLRGHGDSEWAADLDYSISAHVLDLERLVSALRLEDFVLIGMSLGGMIAIEFAARHGNDLKGLAIVDTGVRTRTVDASRIRDFVTDDAELDSVEEFVERAIRFNPLRRRDLLRVSLLHNLRLLPNGKWTWKYDRRHFDRLEHSASGRALSETEARLPAISCPTLVVRGARSEIFTAEEADLTTSLLPNGRLATVPDAGHTVQGDNPRELSAALTAFLREVGA